MTERRTADDLPAGWAVKRFRDFLSESRVSGSNGRDAKKITIKLYGRGIQGKLEKRVGSKNTQYFLRRAGQFMYSKLDFLNGAFAIVPEYLDGFESTVDLPAFDVAKTVDKAWLLSYVSRESFYQKYVDGALGSRKARRVNPDEFLTSKVLVPPLLEQQRIASILSSVDELLRVSALALEQLRVVRRGVMQKLLTRDTKKVAIKSFARVEQGYTFSPKYQRQTSGAYLYAKVSDMTMLGNERWISDAANWVEESVLKEMGVVPFPAKAVIFPRVGASLRTNKKRMLIQDSLIDDNLLAIIIEKPNLCLPEFLLELFEIFDLSSISNDGPVPSITRKSVQLTEVFLPPLEQQKNAIKTLAAFDERITLERARVDGLETLKKGLMQQLLTGKLRVIADGTDQ